LEINKYIDLWSLGEMRLSRIENLGNLDLYVKLRIVVDMFAYVHVLRWEAIERNNLNGGK